MNAADITNAIVDQKNALLMLVTHADDAENLEFVARQLVFLADLWNACGYGYKITEIRSAIRQRADKLEIEEQEFLRHCRKNASCRRSTEREIVRLKVIIATCF